ncbi:anaerobic ribonucleoside-triphosphate reductase activating protein [Lutibacter oricola]|uniref:Anaerobic ribonucleoside-triphosphate reductase activating protein n=1 Tax=Lutibacter oricola TaxID=762486 RepID=A0A1H3F6C4_9FLAO|nr:anaerobic ribonucleoside-triphosphate reductase activating protein [Lutibacter oricola]SDX85709.1 anaerobic ribonucleoside-triphosphate reductase activating protein [Lutibacter oricola]
MNYSDINIALQEVPGEISISFTITGCNIKCDGCHSSYLWNKNNGSELTEELYIKTLSRYKNLASCILFMGGEWHEKELIKYLKLARTLNFTTCLYTGKEQVSQQILDQLTWIKTGPWIKELGGLDSPITNQQFKKVNSYNTLNHLFLKN